MTLKVNYDYFSGVGGIAGNGIRIRAVFQWLLYGVMLSFCVGRITKILTKNKYKWHMAKMLKEATEKNGGGKDHFQIQAYQEKME